MNSIAEYYMWFKACHLISVISWMVGLLYMPRLFVYHTRAIVGSELDQTLKIMELKLLKVIMNPAMIATYLFGTILMLIYGFSNLGVWFHIKLSLVITLSIVHAIIAGWRKDFDKGQNKHSEKFYRLINEIPSIIMVVIVILVIVKPFD